MPVRTPTWAEFHELEARVAALEGAVPQPEPPDPQPEPPAQGVQAKRVAQLVEMGINTFSSLDPDANVWGSWPADYSPASVIDAIRYCWPESTGFAPKLREYHYAGRQDMQAEWLRQLRAKLPDLETTICVGVNGEVADADTLLSLYSDGDLGIHWIEGINEPNLDFGWGLVPIERTMDIQRWLLAGAIPDDLMGPSIVFGLPGAAGWIEGYCGEYLEELQASLAYANGHYYPPACPDKAGSGYELDAVTGDLWRVYGGAPVVYTEFHPTLYGASDAARNAVKSHIAALAGRLGGHEPPPIVGTQISATRDPYYTLVTLLRTCKQGCGHVWWYALFDYADVYTCGLFPKRHADDPRSTATVLRHLAFCCTDKSDTTHSFAPGKLGVRVSGLPPHGDWDLYQASSGQFFLPIWLSADDPGGPETQVTIEFDRPMQWVTDIDLLAMRRVGSTLTNVEAFTKGYANGVRLLVIEP